MYYFILCYFLHLFNLFFFCGGGGQTGHFMPLGGGGHGPVPPGSAYGGAAGAIYINDDCPFHEQIKRNFRNIIWIIDLILVIIQKVFLQNTFIFFA